MSAMSNLAGLYPPVKEQEWNPDLLWQPIPVHTLPLEEDNVISSHANCPRLKKLMEELSSDPTIKDIIAKNDWVFKYLTNHTGAPVTGLLDIDYLYDTLYIEHLYNLTLPEWTHRVFPDQMKLAKVVPLFKTGENTTFNNFNVIYGRPQDQMPAKLRLRDTLASIHQTRGAAFMWRPLQKMYGYKSLSPVLIFHQSEYCILAFFGKYWLLN